MLRDGLAAVVQPGPGTCNSQHWSTLETGALLSWFMEKGWSWTFEDRGARKLAFPRQLCHTEKEHPSHAMGSWMEISRLMPVIQSFIPASAGHG